MPLVPTAVHVPPPQIPQPQSYIYKDYIFIQKSSSSIDLIEFEPRRMRSIPCVLEIILISKVSRLGTFGRLNIAL